MSHLRIALAAPLPPTVHWHSDSPSKLGQTRKWVHDHLTTDAIAIPDNDTLQPLAKKLLTVFREKGSFSTLNRKELRFAPWAVFYRTQSGHMPININGFAHWYLQEIATQLHGRRFLSVIQTYFLCVNDEQEWLPSYAHFLRKHIEEFDNSRVTGWRDRHFTYGLLNDNAPEHLATQLIDTKVSTDAFFTELGFFNELRERGFIERMDVFLIGEVQRKLEERAIGIEKLAQVLTVFEPKASGKEQFRLRGIKRVAVINALLLPFTVKQPEAPLKSMIKVWLLRNFGDPRLTPASWVDVAPSAINVIKTWLVEETLETFFRVIDKVASRYSGSDTQWVYRSNYWKRYLQSGFITDAWMVLGRTIRSDARLLLGSSQIPFANLHAGDGAQPEHATLIMRVGGVVVTEWSHNAKCRVWATQLNYAPSFYKSTYRRYELVSHADHEQIHHGASTHTWQRQLDSYLRTHAGIRI